MNLFAALEVVTGVIRGKTTQTKKRADFQAFMEEVIAEQPADRQIHVILDNLNTHKKNEEWLSLIYAIRHWRTRIIVSTM